MAEGSPTISTHILDTALGRPAAGVRVTLERLAADGSATPAGDGRTDDDGRVRRLLDGELTPGAYRLTFHLDDPARFFRRVTLDVVVRDAGRSYHVPLLLAPYGVTSYRGS